MARPTGPGRLAHLSNRRPVARHFFPATVARQLADCVPAGYWLN